MNQNPINIAALYNVNTGFSPTMTQTGQSGGGMFQALLDEALIQRLQADTSSSQRPASGKNPQTNSQSSATNMNFASQWAASLLQSLPVPGLGTGSPMTNSNSWLGGTSSMANLLAAIQPPAQAANTPAGLGSAHQTDAAKINPLTLQGLAESAAAQYGIPVKLILSVIHQESGGNPNAVSSAGAKGLMQLMPDTASTLGVTNVFDPVQNINAGTRYLSQLLNRFKSVPLALAAYNAGPEAVARYQGIPPYAETQTYVQNIIDNLRNL